MHTFSRTTKLAAIATVLALGGMNPVSLAGVRAAGTPQLFVGDALNPAAYGFPITAQEVASKRSEYSAVFELQPGSFAAVSSAAPLFTKDENGLWIPIRLEGRHEGGEFVFDRLAGDTEIRFDLTHPQYTLHHNGHWYSIRFSAPAQGVIESADTIAYRLADGVTLRWTVEGQRVRKEVLFADAAATADLSFTVTSDLDAHLEDNHLTFGDVFSFPKPFLTDLDARILNTPVTLTRNGNTYDFQYQVPDHPYILDPSEGPNSPSSSVNDNSVGSVPWGTPSFATASDNSYADTSSASTTSSNYLYASDFGFSIPSGSTIDGIELSIEHNCSDSSACADNILRLVKGGTISGNDKASSSYWPTSDATATYGGASDTWGVSWTASDINASNFGVVLSASLTAAGGFGGVVFNYHDDLSDT